MVLCCHSFWLHVSVTVTLSFLERTYCLHVSPNVFPCHFCVQPSVASICSGHAVAFSTTIAFIIVVVIKLEILRQHK